MRSEDTDARQRLLERRRSIAEALQVNREGAEELVRGLVTAGAQDRLEIAEMLERLARREEHELAEIDAALGRLARGEYGRCLSCGEPIEAARLAAKPESEGCARCSATEEARP